MITQRLDEELFHLTVEVVDRLSWYQGLARTRGALTAQEQAARAQWARSLPDPLRVLASAVIGLGRDARIWRYGEDTVAIGYEGEEPDVVLHVPLSVAEGVEEATR